MFASAFATDAEFCRILQQAPCRPGDIMTLSRRALVPVFVLVKVRLAIVVAANVTMPARKSITDDAFAYGLVVVVILS